MLSLTVRLTRLRRDIPFNGFNHVSTIFMSDNLDFYIKVFPSLTDSLCVMISMSRCIWVVVNCRLSRTQHTAKIFLFSFSSSFLFSFSFLFSLTSSVTFTSLSLSCHNHHFQSSHNTVLYLNVRYAVVSSVHRSSRIHLHLQDLQGCLREEVIWVVSGEGWINALI